MRAWILLVVVVACHRAPTDHATVDPHPVQLEAASSVGAAPAASAAPVVHDAGPPPDIVWRVLDHKYVENDSGYPTQMYVEIQVEAAGQTLGPWKFAAPACMRGTPTLKNGVAMLSCYWGGAGDYVEVVEKKDGYAVMRYAQGEGYADEPAPRHEGLTTIGTIKTKDHLGSDAMLTPDGGAYTPYGP